MDGKDSDAGLTDSQKAIKTAYENGEINEMMEAQIKGIIVNGHLCMTQICRFPTYGGR